MDKKEITISFIFGIGLMLFLFLLAYSAQKEKYDDQIIGYIGLIKDNYCINNGMSPNTVFSFKRGLLDEGYGFSCANDSIMIEYIFDNQYGDWNLEIVKRED